MDQLAARQSLAATAAAGGATGSGAALALGVRPFTPVRPHAHSLVARRQRMESARRIGEVLAELQATPPDDAPQRPYALGTAPERTAGPLLSHGGTDPAYGWPRYLELMAPRPVTAPMTPRSAALLQRSPAPGRVSMPAGGTDSVAASPGRRTKSAATQLLEEMTQLTALEQELENALTAELRAPVRSSPRLQAKARALPRPADAAASAKENAAPPAIVDEYATWRSCPG